MKFMIALVPISVCLLLVACGDGGGGDRQPLMDVAGYIRTQPQPNVFEPQGLILPDGEHDCLIPAKPSPRSTIEGTCEWSVEEAGDGWIVRIRETWDCADFNALEGTSNFCPGETGTREWTYEVTADGAVKLFVENGDLPPESLAGE
jgi:hypothetical protein